MIQLSKYYIMLSVAFVITLISCQNFDKINQDPNSTDEDRVPLGSFLNGSIYEAQMNPHIAERIFILYWDRAARYEMSGALAVLASSNSWTSDYFSRDYSGRWINQVHLAVTVGEKRIASEDPSINIPLTINIVNVARIWRVYLYSELSDNFGPYPRSEAFNLDISFPKFDDVEAIYKWMIEELTDAVTQIDISIKDADFGDRYDQLFQGDFERWIKYANSMRLRLAMRLSEIDEPYAKAQFEAAVATDNFITELEDIASVQEGGGWIATTGVMTRSNNIQQLSLTMANIYIGLGGISLTTLKGVQGLSIYNIPNDVINEYGKDPKQYLGLEMPNYLSSKTNVQTAGYFFDAIPDYSDPRLFKNFSVPGYDDGVVQHYKDPLATNTNVLTAKYYIDDNGDDRITAGRDTIVFRAKYTFNGRSFGNTRDKGTLFSTYTSETENTPAKSSVWRDNNQKRVFFAPWETYFLLAEAALYKWNTGGVSDNEAYEKGITSSFEYFEIKNLAQNYLSSDSYNRIGTSVSFGHTAEASDFNLEIINLEDNLVQISQDTSKNTKNFALKSSPITKTITYKYPEGFSPNNNDVLTKIITQKYIANYPWLPLEAWSDYRRLGLPFMENPVLETEISTMPGYTDFTKALIENIPGRLPYPQSISVNNQIGYQSALDGLGAGGDEIQTKLWWAKKE